MKKTINYCPFTQLRWFSSFHFNYLLRSINNYFFSAVGQLTESY